MSNEPDLIDRAIARLYPHRTFRDSGRTITIACLIRVTDWRPLDAPWWKGKEVCIIGADLNGNFFLRHCDGTVRHFNHQLGFDTLVAASVKEFVAKIE
jgi:hypothetical protein